MEKIGYPDVCIAGHIPSQSYICSLGLNSARTDKKYLFYLGSMEI